MLCLFIFDILIGFDNSETRDMLLHAGLDDIIHIRPSAQIAYLLVERARLMDIIEEWQNEYRSDLGDGTQSARQLINRRRDLADVRNFGLRFNNYLPYMS